MIHHKFPDEVAGGMVDELRRRRDLLDPPVLHHHDPVGQGECLLLVMGNKDHGDAKFLLQGFDLPAHGEPGGYIQGGQGLVKEDNIRAQHHGAGNGDPLLLTAGELDGLLVLQL